MIGPTPFRDILLIAGFELREMRRTRLAWVLIALYSLGGLVAALGFIWFVGRFEAVLADALAVSHTQTPGALTQRLLAGDSAFFQVLTRLLPTRDAAEFVLRLPPIVWVYALFSFWFVPVLIAITASGTVPQETQNRGMRFLALRTGRLEIVVGKYLGQAILMAGVTWLMGMVFIAVAANGYHGFEFMPTFRGIMIFWPRVVVYCFAFVGLTALFSMNASSSILSRVYSLIGLTAFWWLARRAEGHIAGGLGFFWEVVDLLLPFGHQDALWSPSWMDVAFSALILLALSALYIVCGLLLFRRKDL